MLGDVSPTLACPNAAIKSSANCTSACPAEMEPLLGLLLLLAVVCLAAHFSRNWEATPLLSPLMRSLVLLIEVQCTGNQLMAPVPKGWKEKLRLLSAMLLTAVLISQRLLSTEP